MSGHSKTVVYTCITNGYDTLREIRYLSPDIDYVCFTDNANLKSKTWEIRPIPDDLKNVAAEKKQRLVKILPHKYLPQYDVSLWVDSNIEVISDLKDFFAKYSLSRPVFLYVNKHPTRDCIYREHLAVIKMKKDTFENTTPQIDRYREEGFPEHYGLAETNIMLRAHNDAKCIRLMNLWGEEILNGSHRDQLSFNYAVWKSGMKEGVRYLEEKYYNLYVSDNAFFKLRRHVRIMDYKPIVVDFSKGDSAAPIPPSPKVEVMEPKASEPKPEPDGEGCVPVSVVVFTHDRTNVAVETVKSLLKNLIYPNIQWILTDDRSKPGHVEALLDTFGSFGVKPVVCRTTDGHFGLGAAMNIGLKAAFERSDVALRVEDDWLLERPFDIGRHAEILLKNSKVAGIRLGMVGGGVYQDPMLYANKDYKVMVGNNADAWLMNNQVMMVHRRLHDNLGWYRENVSADDSENEFRTRFNVATRNGRERLFVLVPSEMKWRTFDDKSLWFIHIGRSTLGHAIYKEPKRYSWIYEKRALAITNKLTKDTMQKDNNSPVSEKTEKICVYTCILNNYDGLKEVPKTDKIDFICFTDDLSISSNGWKLVEIPSEIKKYDPTRVNRLVKILPHRFLPKQYSKSLWIDGNIKILSLEKILSFFKKYPLNADNYVYIRRHPNRKCIYEEAKVCIKQSKDVSETIEAQMLQYRAEKFPENYGLFENNIIYRDHNNENCIKLMERWSNEVLKHSKRDQLSLVYAAWKTNTKISTLNESIRGEHEFNVFKIFSHNLDGKGITVVMCNYNTANLTNACIMSIIKNSGLTNFHIIVLDNSDGGKFKLDKGIDESKVTVLDNTSGKYIDFKEIVKRYKGKDEISVASGTANLRHAYSVQFLINVSNTERILLFDNDTLLKKKIDFIDDRYVTIAGYQNSYRSMRGNVLRKPRLLPWIQFFNKKLLLLHKISYFNPNKIMGGLTSNSKYYDTGASFTEMVNQKKLPYKIIKFGEYIKHLQGASWARVHDEYNFLKVNDKYHGMKTIHEKLVYLMNNDNPPLKSVCADKIEVRNYIKDKLDLKDDSMFVPIVKVYKKAEDINFDELPKQCVLKCNHGSGFNIICNKSNLNKEKIVAQMNDWMKVDYGKLHGEKFYSAIDRRIYCEKFIQENFLDYKYWCFNGKPEFFTVNEDVNVNNYPITFYDIGGKLLKYSRIDHPALKTNKYIFSKDRLALMEQYARKLAKDFKFVRVDMLVSKEKIYFGELTFIPNCGNIYFQDKKHDFEVGSFLKI